MDSTGMSVDQSALKFNQASIVTLVVLGYVLDEPLLLAGVALVLIAGGISPSLALFKLVYAHAAKPLKLIQPRIVDESPAPHEFAQLLGGTVLAVGVMLLYLGVPFLGWVVSWVVVVLAATNLFFGFCSGCFVYYQLGRFGVPGFRPRTGAVGRSHVG
jgi:hypothetical protein